MWEPRDIAEVWVQVYSTELVNLTDIVAKMDDEQKRSWTCATGSRLTTRSTRTTSESPTSGTRPGLSPRR